MGPPLAFIIAAGCLGLGGSSWPRASRRSASLRGFRGARCRRRDRSRLEACVVGRVLRLACKALEDSIRDLAHDQSSSGAERASSTFVTHAPVSEERRRAVRTASARFMVVRAGAALRAPGGCWETPSPDLARPTGSLADSRWLEGAHANPGGLGREPAARKAATVFRENLLGGGFIPYSSSKPACRSRATSASALEACSACA